jgi:hypothetical protein
MIDLLPIVCFLIAVIALAGVVYFWRLNARRSYTTIPTSTDTSSSRVTQVSQNILPTDLMEGKSHTDLLPVIRPGQVVTFTGDKERMVTASIELEERTQDEATGQWSHKANSYAILLGDLWIMRIPETEGGRSRWYKLMYHSSMGLAEALRGGNTPDTYGPARLFNKSRQAKAVEFELPNDLTPGVRWKMVDLGSFQAHFREDSQKTELITDGDIHMFATAQEVGGERVFIFLDPRPEPGSTTGRGGLFIGDPFDPETEVSDIL